MSGRPLDVLEESLQEPVEVRLKDGTSYYGALAGYDQHMNVVLEPLAHDEDLPGDLELEEVEDTTIIRGDNVVSIRT